MITKSFPKLWTLLLLLMAMICFPAFGVYAQQSKVKITVSGVVQDQTGLPVPGATVVACLLYTSDAADEL